MPLQILKHLWLATIFVLNVSETFTDNEAFDNHVCGLCVKAKKRKVRHEKKMVDELAHYLQSGVSKGGQDEIAFRTQKVKSEKNISKNKR
jgi:hypothetical protein